MRIISLRFANTIENTTKTKPFGEFGDFRWHVGAHFGAPIPCWWTTNTRQFKGFGRFGGTCGSSFRASDFASATRKHNEFPRQAFQAHLAQMSEFRFGLSQKQWKSMMF